MKLLRIVWLVAAAWLFAALAFAQSPPRTAPGPVTWSRQIAPIVYRNCAACHHPGGAGPFSLLSYADARRRAPQILDVTQSRYMPPWLPAPGFGDFANARRLSDEDLALIRTWVKSGMAQGDPSRAPSPPHYDATWQLGKPDLILSIEHPWTLPASGSDVFRNFVLPYTLAQTHYIRAMEILPGAPQAVHHANVLIDRTASFRRDHPDNWKDGVPGMELELDAGNTFDPDSHFLFWKPDTPVLREAPDMPWRLDPGNDLILNMHLKPSGKPETIDARIGLWFADQPGSKFPMLLQLDDDRDLDIPAGARNFAVHDELTLPVDVNVLGIYPHAHYLGRELDGWATLPDGQRRWLIRIPNWDIDRQSVYRYRNPVFLPRGTVLHMHYVYDNSADNIHNPNSPPIRVRAGNRSVDEMAHLWIQVLPVNTPAGAPDPRLLLERAWMEHRLAKEPGDAIALYNLAATLVALGQYRPAIDDYRRLLAEHPAAQSNAPRTLNSLGAALEKSGDTSAGEDAFRRALAVEPSNCDARFNLASVALRQSRFPDAESQFRAVIAHCPADAGAHDGLGVALLAAGDAGPAEAEFHAALAIDAADFTALYHLGEIAIASGHPADAIEPLLAASKRNPGDVDTRERLAMAFAQTGRANDALAQLRDAEQLAPSDSQLHSLLSQLLAGSGRLQQAIDEQNLALHLEPRDADGWNNLGVLEARIGKPDAARADFEHALQLSPDNAEARANLARLPPH